jgi:integrase
MKKRNLNETEQNQLVEHLQSSTLNHSDIVALLFVSGIRTHELLSLKVRDLDFTAQTLTLWDGAKGSTGRVLGLPLWYISRARGKVLESGLSGDERLLEALGYRGEKWNDATVKAILRRSWQRIKAKVWGRGALKLGLHALRHTFAVNLYKATNDHFMVQNALGHKSFSSTQRYLVYNNEPAQIQAMKSLYEKFERKAS